jgi:hypothetical protein
VTKEVEKKIKVVQTTSLKTPATKSRRIRSAVEVTLADDIKDLPAAHPTKEIKSELSDALPVASSRVALKTPEPILPKNQFHAPYPAKGEGSIIFQWKSVAGAKSYHLFVSDSKDHTLFDDDVRDTQVLLPHLTPDVYQWSVYANADGTTYSDSSPPRYFSIDDPPQVHWANTNDTYLYTTPKPTLNLAWMSSDQGQFKNKIFKISLKKDGESVERTLNSKDLSTLVALNQEGTYSAHVELLNDAGKSVSSTEVREIKVKMRPLLPAPSFGERSPASIMASRGGAVRVIWEKVAGANNYTLRLINAAGSLLKTEKVSTNFYALSGLMPGEYKVQLATVDQYDRQGSFGPEKEIRVPNISDVRGPKLRKIEIK